MLSTCGSGNNATFTTPPGAAGSWSAHTVLEEENSAGDSNRAEPGGGLGAENGCGSWGADDVSSGAANGGADGLDASVLELQSELEEILQQLDAMFPAAASARPTSGKLGNYKKS